MTIIKRKISINRSKDEVWKALADFGKICHGHPAVKTSHVTSEKKQGLGATRHCDFTMMNATAEERVVEWNEGSNIKMEVYKFENMPGIDTAILDLKIEALNEDKTMLTGIFKYTMKNILFDAINAIAMKRANAKLINGIMAGHKKYIETGEIVTDKTHLDLKKVIKIS
ncbi:MAG: SRPBCC family protein [Bacteroidetes bacterium]|nr:SRPBCC family protein [Bacteroidota bacterium]